LNGGFVPHADITRKGEAVMLRPILYHDPTSEPSRAVHWFTQEANIDVDINYTWLTRGDHMKPEFLLVNPEHQVPALRHGEFCLSEASAMMIYLAEIHNIQDRWIGISAQDKAKTFQIMSWHHTNTRLAITLNYFLPVLLMPAYFGEDPPGDETVRQLRKAGMESLLRLNQILAGQGTFLGGNEPSLADLFIAPDLFALDIDPKYDDWFTECHAVSEWLATLRNRDGYKSSHSCWNSIVPRLLALLNSESVEQRNPSWVADL
jgi:glutathione S-transferase